MQYTKAAQLLLCAQLVVVIMQQCRRGCITHHPCKLLFLGSVLAHKVHQSAFSVLLLFVVGSASR